MGTVQSLDAVSSYVIQRLNAEILDEDLISAWAVVMWMEGQERHMTPR